MKMLLHSCCAPCSVYCLRSLRDEGIEPTLFWYNPNIHPYTEYKARRNCLIEFAKNMQIQLEIEDFYGLDEFCKNTVSKLTTRCEDYCYPTRLRRSFEFAKEHGYDAISTTLLYSIYQKHDKIAEIMTGLAQEFGINFIYRDWRKGWRDGQDEARAAGLYMQKYCGCVFSEEESFIGREISRKLQKQGISPTNAEVRKVIENSKERGFVALEIFKKNTSN